MQNEATSRNLAEERSRAIVPFAILSVLLIVSYFTIKVEIMNRPILKPIEEKTAEEEAKPPEPGPMQGKAAPAFDLASIDGKRFKLSDYKGKLVFLNVWATWCPPCRDEMPSMERLYKELKGPYFEMLAVSIDEDGTESVPPFVKEMGITFPVLLDPEKKDTDKYKEGGIAKNYMITGVPETYLIAGNGVVILHFVGPTEWDRPEIIDVLKGLVKRIEDSTTNSQ
ncbi:MAG: TlpA family protein disulfide reductase [Nitrospinota bacterium]|nr:TlpA family protein disulfide reductase [Nitrospinota bacterium]